MCNYALSLNNLFLAIVMTIYQFLACNKPIYTAEILVVEGWLPELSLKSAIEEFNRSNYRYIVATGGFIRERGIKHEVTNYADFAALSMMSFGFDRNLIITVSASNAKWNRTFASAIAFKNWLVNRGNDITAVNIYTYSTHARKSIEIYRRILAPLNIEVGVISSHPVDFDPRKWFLCKKGMKWVIMETIGYFYALLVYQLRFQRHAQRNDTRR